jgi:DNA-binding CsgD family transcriptional regulator
VRPAESTRTARAGPVTAGRGFRGRVASRLLERDGELGAADGLIEATRHSAGCILAVEGPAGIGKTRLLEAVRIRASRSGLAVLSARGGELERDFAFGVVQQLFEPTLVSAPDAERETLLAGAAALATHALGHVKDRGPESPAGLHSTLHGLYWFAANLAARRPLMICVDDAHWSDTPSLRFLAYLARRLEGLPLMLAVGTRPPEASAVESLLLELLSDPATWVLRPGPLSEAAVSEVLRAGLGVEVEDEFIRACHEVTMGNPFLVIELVGALRAEGAVGTVSDAQGLRELTPLAVSRAVLHRLAGLPAGAGQLARAVAVLGDGAALEDAGALAVLDDGQVGEAVQALARAEILHPDPPLRFIHPMIRAAVYADISRTDRALRHARAARFLSERGADTDQVAAHLLAASPGADGWVVDVLRTASERALARAAPEVATTYLRRALAEPPPAELRPEVLLELGLAEARSDLGGTESMAEALELSSTPGRRAEIALALGRTLGLRGRHAEAVEVLQEAMSEPADADDPQLKLRIEAEMVAHCLHSAEKLPLGFERLRHVPFEETHGGAAERLLLALAGFALTASGRLTPDAAVALARRTAREGALTDEENSSLLLFTAETLVFADHLNEADELLERAIGEARRRGSAPAVALASAFRSQVAFRRGSLSDAEADARTALGLVDREVLGYSRTYVVSFLVDALTERGEYEDAERVLAEVGPSEDWPELWQFMLLTGSRGRLKVAQGRVAGGLADHLECGRRARPWRPRNPSTVPWRSDAALAHARLGDTEEARRLASWQLRNARAYGAPRGLGVSLRVAGLVEGGSRGLELLRESATVLGASAAKLEHARTLTDLGAALRRDGRRSEARGPLRLGLDLARRCGARPLAELALEELAATGARPRRMTLTGIEALTPSERRVASMAASGLTNREVAQALFVTEKTVEVHLTRAYRKLDIGARSELARALESAPPGAD